MARAELERAQALALSSGDQAAAEHIRGILRGLSLALRWALGP